MKFKDYIKRPKFRKEIDKVESLVMVIHALGMIDAISEEMPFPEIREEFRNFTEKIRNMMNETEVGGVE